MQDIIVYSCTKAQGGKYLSQKCLGIQRLEPEAQGMFTATDNEDGLKGMMNAIGIK